MKQKLKFFLKIICRILLGFLILTLLGVGITHFLPYSLQQSWCSYLGGFRSWLIQNHPGLYDKQRSFYDGEHSWFFPSDNTSKKQAVILVHGLDEPGPIWDDLIPALNKKGYVAYSFIYPNDLGVHASSELFFDRLIQLKKEGVVQLVIVAHSMGGLVARNAITHPQFEFIESMETGKIPVCERIITVGTPNYGSQFAKARFFSEFRDQWRHIINGQHGFLGGIFDGTGQAGLDLYPDSPFLTKLNAREYPNEKIPMTIIAAVLIDSEPQKASIIEENPTHQKKQSDFQSLWEKVGDGLVSLKSAALPYIDDIYIIPANHHDILHNMSYQNDRIPPAIPVILKIVDGYFGEDSSVLSENSVENLP